MFTGVSRIIAKENYVFTHRFLRKNYQSKERGAKLKKNNYNSNRKKSIISSYWEELDRIAIFTFVYCVFVFIAVAGSSLNISTDTIKGKGFPIVTYIMIAWWIIYIFLEIRFIRNTHKMSLNERQKLNYKHGLYLALLFWGGNLLVRYAVWGVGKEILVFFGITVLFYAIGYASARTEKKNKILIGIGSVSGVAAVIGITVARSVNEQFGGLAVVIRIDILMDVLFAIISWVMGTKNVLKLIHRRKRI